MFLWTLFGQFQIFKLRVFVKFYFENSKILNDYFLWKFILKIQNFQNSLIDQVARLREETDWERGPIDFAVYTQYEGGRTA